MSNKDKKITKLLESGFSYETINKMNDYHMNRLYEAMSAGDAEELATNLKGAAMAAKELESSLENLEEEFYEDINEEEVIEALFGKPKNKKTPPTSLGMFEGEVEEKKEEKIRQIEESIVSLIKKSQGKMLTKGDILSEEPSIAPARPTVKPGVKPERGTPYRRPNPGPSPRPKASDTETAPTRVKPGTKEKPSRTTPYRRPNPGPAPRPKAGDESGLPEFLKFSNLNIQFRDE